MKRALMVVALVAACGSDKSEPSAQAKQTTTAVAPVTPIATADAMQAAIPADAAAATIKLPAKGFDAHKVLGAAKAQVATQLGRGEPPEDRIGMLHELGSEADENDILVRVEYDENGKAGFLVVIGHAYPKDMSPADVDAVLAFAGATRTDEWRFGDEGIELWDKTALERAKERKRIGGLLGDYLKQIGAGGGHARKDLDTSLLVRVPYGTTCTRALLTKYRDEFVENIGADLKALGFVELTCDVDGAVLKLR